MQKDLIERNPVLKQTIEFSLLVISYCEILDSLKKYIISKQLLRSAISIGANAMEAQNAESKADFIHKIKVVLKEIMETRVNLRIIMEKPLISNEKVSAAFKECNELMAIFLKSIETAKKNKANN